MEPLSLRNELRQQLKLSPQVLQSMEVLQMNSQELLEYLGRLSEENPVLEQEDNVSLHAAYQELRRRASWIDGGVSGPGGGAELPERGSVDHALESLPAFLRDQLDRRRLPGPLLALTRYMAEMVDGDGFLAQEDLESLRELKIPEKLIRRALDTLQSLDPAGVGARDIPECLLLQLDRRKNVSPAVREIAARFLPELGRKHYGLIARALELPVAEVREAERVIAGLDPYPGRAFQAAETVAYVRPDVFVVEEAGELQVVLNEYYLPRITISPYYARLLRDSDEAETREYLRQKMQQAKWLLNSLDRRGSTLRRCVEELVQVQRRFFTGESRELVPMKLVSLAEVLGLHASTVSRAVRDKYLQCRQGTYALRYFFNRAVGEASISRQAVKQRLLELVREEDPRRPLSDEGLCRLLAADGAEVARRTVAKYRGELGIPCAAGRRRER